MNDDLDALLRPIWAWNKLPPAADEALEALRAQGAPQALVRFYAMGNGGGSEGIRFFPASLVRRGHGDVNAQSVRGQIAFADNGRDAHRREIYTIDRTGFFGLGEGAIVRGEVPLVWGWSKLVAPDAVALFQMIRKGGAPRATGIPKRARAELQKALRKHAARVRVTPGPVDDAFLKRDRDPDRVMYNFKHDGKSYLPWAISHLYYVLDGLDVDGGDIVVRPFMDLERTPDAWVDNARGFVFAQGRGCVFVATREAGAIPEGLATRVDGGDPSTARVLGHLVDVVTRWVKGERPEGMPVRAWAVAHGR